MTSPRRNAFTLFEVLLVLIILVVLAAIALLGMLVLFDLDRAWQVKDGQLPGKAQNSPFDGRALEGRVTATFKAGRKVFSA
jgi:prepilin-type N-terminal cleavage/methylation domain-containing protein